MSIKAREMTADEEAFLQQILEDRDRLFQETSRLKGQLTDYENFESERVSYQDQIAQKDQTINQLDTTINQLDQTINQLDATISKLKQQVDMLLRKIS